MLTELLALVGVGVVARLVASRFRTVSYSVVLVLFGLVVSALPVSTTLPLSHDLIFLVVLPPILFAGGLRLDYRATAENAEFLALVLLVGLPAAILGMGIVGQYVFPYPLVVTLLLAAMVYPLDPVAVLSVFDSLDAPDRLQALVEGEPLGDDGLAVVFFGTFLGLFRTTVETGTTLPALLSPGYVVGLAVDFVVVSAGGVVVGLGFGGLLVVVSHYLGRDDVVDVLLSLFAAYGSVLVAEHYLHVSSILAAVAASVAVGYAGQRGLLTAESLEFVRSSWEEPELLANTFVYVLIGAYTDLADLLALADLVVVATVLFLLARAVVVAGATWLANRVLADPIPWSYAPVLVWGALHTVVPIAVALALPASLPYTAELRTIVFGVAVVSILGQGLTVPVVLRALGLAGRDT